MLRLKAACAYEMNTTIHSRALPNIEKLPHYDGLLHSKDFVFVHAFYFLHTSCYCLSKLLLGEALQREDSLAEMSLASSLMINTYNYANYTVKHAIICN